MPKKTPPPFKSLKARKGQAVAHVLVSVDLEGNTAVYDTTYEMKDLGGFVSRIRSDDPNAEVYYVPVVLPIPKKARPVKTAKAKAKKIAKPKPKDVDTKQEAPKKKRTKKTLVMKAATQATRTREPTPEPIDDPQPIDDDDGF